METILEHAKALLDAQGIDYVCINPKGIRFDKDGYTIEIIIEGNPIIAIKDANDDNMSWEWARVTDYKEVIDNPNDWY